MIPNAKDPSEAFQAGLDLRAWILAGLPGPFQKPRTPAPGQGLGKRDTGKTQYRPIPEAWRGLDEGTIERFCIATVDGGLSDTDAERRDLH